jgi:pimeloyl-ACP methyl ester carboxylesterase
MQPNPIYFLHGLDSSGSGTKGRFFARALPEVIRADFTGSLNDRLEQLDSLCHDQQRLILIGSSFGGLMATCYATAQPEKVARLVLLAPALNFAGYRPPATRLQIPVLLVIGRHDTITPPALVVPLAQATFADLDIRLEDDDHLLHKSFLALNWSALLLRRT